MQNKQTGPRFRKSLPVFLHTSKGTSRLPAWPGVRHSARRVAGADAAPPRAAEGRGRDPCPQGGEQGWWELLGEKPLCPPPGVTLILVPFDLSLFSPLSLSLLSSSCSSAVLLILRLFSCNRPGGPTQVQARDVQELFHLWWDTMSSNLLSITLLLSTCLLLPSSSGFYPVWKGQDEQ